MRFRALFLRFRSFRGVWDLASQNAGLRDLGFWAWGRPMEEIWIEFVEEEEEEEAKAEGNMYG